MNGYDPSSQIVFSPRQSVFFTTYSMVNGHVFSSRSPALRAASVEPSAVRPDGLGDARESFSQTTVDHSSARVEGERPAVRGWQDKAVLTDGPPASSQPGPDTIVARSSVVDSAGVRSQNHSDAKERLVKGAVWMKPGVKEALESLADQTGLSFSATAAKGLEIYARVKIQDQQEELFEPKMRAMLRREIRSSDNRHVPFEIKNAVAAEQTRILITDLYKRMLLKEGMPLKAINKKLDDTYNMARTNVFNTQTPKFKSLVAKYWQTTEDLSADRQDQASDRQDPAGSSQTENAPVRETGTGKPKA
jgi:hypothetical protein